jgi:chemotaxis protein CheD
MEPVFTYSTRINLNPGDLYIAEKPAVVWTVLGSCIAIIFYNARLKIGAISHAQLAEERLRDSRCSDFCPHPCYAAAPDTNRFKYATCSFRYMYEYFMHIGSEKQDIAVKLFGGANMFPIHQQTKGVGAENIEVVRKMIDTYGMRLASEHIGGTAGRTLYFYTDSGEVWLKQHTPRFFGQSQTQRSTKQSFKGHQQRLKSSLVMGRR